MSSSRNEPPREAGVHSREKAAIEQLIREIGEYQLQGFHTICHSDIAVKDETSYGYSVVTEYDLESERRVFKFISEYFPNDSFLGEEHGNVLRNPDRYWILDPIDGTTNFTQGVPFWGPSLALCDAKGPVEGWIFFPVLNQMFYAARGKGAHLNGSAIRTSSVAEYSNLCTVGTVSRLHRRFQMRCPAKHRILGSIVVNLTYLAMGSFAAIHCRGSVWDLAAGLLIAREAGAVVDCEPVMESLSLASMDPKSAPSISVYAMANERIPHFKQYLEPLENPVEGK